ncbi:MAG: 3-deoxy-7-phosphoheptulonate synthase [Candidatus Aureabacteria bacterium]|nr:3-deoxy-7-phosphoheptulonate synthase [Candidatus Auribacterota bacterium]
MIIVLKQGTTEEQKKNIVKKIKELNLMPMVSEGKERTIIGVIGDEEVISNISIEAFQGVEKVMPILKPYKLVGRELKPDNTVIKVGNVEIGSDTLIVMAGPCSVENEKMIIETAKAVKKAGAHILRGGAFKPRTSPYSFQGLGEKGLKFMAKAKEETGLPVVTEVMDTRDVSLVEKYADIIQVGARNMQNFQLLKEVGLCKKPIFLKRGLSSTVKELLMSAEYILSSGNDQVILCERGIRTFEDATRNTLDLSAVPLIKELSHLPVVIDPSHATGKRSLILPMSKAAVASGADGLMIEVHPYPEKAVSDGAQSLMFKEFQSLMENIKPFVEAAGKKM